MIIIDVLNEVRNLPVAFPANEFSIIDVEYRDNQDNEDMPESQRNEVTRTMYVIYADGTPVYAIDKKEDKALEKITAVYDDIMEAIKRGERVYSFRSTEVKADGTDGDNGSNAEDGHDGKDSDTSGDAQIP